MIFCKVDEALIDILHKVANGRRIVDLGAGECLFQYKYSQKYPDSGILSVELHVEAHSHTFIPKDKIVRFYAQKLWLNKNDLPIFIRPCHSDDFVAASLANMKNMVSEALYISNKRNIVLDIPEEYTYRLISDWVGEDDREQIFSIQLHGEQYKPVEKDWWMVKLEHWESAIKMERIERFGEYHFVNQQGGGFPCKAANFAEKIK